MNVRSKWIFQTLTTILSCLCLFVACTFQNDLQWQEEEHHRWAELHPGYFNKTGFEKLNSSATNVLFRNDVRQELIEENRHYLNGSGVAVGDVNGNGLVDIYFASLDGPNKLYENLGNFRFRDITNEAGVAHEDYNSTGVVLADVNGNGYLDLLVSSLSDGNVLYINDGSGKFTLKKDSGLGESRGAKTMTLADINGNGLLDLYIANFKLRTVRDIYGPEELVMENTVELFDGKLEILPEFEEYFKMVETASQSYRNEIGEKDELYINQGNGVFSKADDYVHFLNEDGNGNGLHHDWGLTAKFYDITGNRLPDLYVANDFWTSDRIWINQGDGTFRPIENEAIRNMSFAAMGIDFSDINRDGTDDIVVTEMLSSKHERRMRQYSGYLEEFEGRTLNNRNSLYLNRGDLTFAEIAWYSGLQASEWSWATYFIDITLDGYEDLVVATGYSYDYQDMDIQLAMQEFDEGAMSRGGDMLQYPPLNLANKIFKNNGDLTFTEKSSEWGFDVEDISHGMALADLNNDGDLDLIINRFNDEAVIYENVTNAPRVAVRLRGQAPNTQAIGARIKLSGGPVPQSKQVTSGGNYLSGSQPQVVFAADKDNRNHVITIQWPGGKQSVLEGVKANRIYEIDESGAVEIPASRDKNPQPAEYLFKDVSDKISHTHHENEYDDFRFGPLLPKILSRPGPGLAWFDITQNGFDDLLITSGKGGSLAILENSGDGDFYSIEMPSMSDAAPGDQTSVIGWRENNHTKIVIGSANYEQGDPTAPSAYIYSIESNGTMTMQDIPGILSTTGPVAAADYTGNGYVDLFIGGSFKPGQYPISADSRLFVNENGQFHLDQSNSQELVDAGLVTDALFADFTENGFQDLLVSTEWGTLRLFENNKGTFREITSNVGLDQYKGWWNAIAVGDFTNNGRPDIVATNIGLNSPYQMDSDNPLKLFYDDFNWDGRLNIIDAYYLEERDAYVPRRKLHDFSSIPTILRNIRSHAEFAESAVDQIFDHDFSQVPFKEINTLQSMIFIHTGEEFEAMPLPVKAQFTTGVYAGVYDFDNDGNEDLFLGQNFFGYPKNIPRQDAGRGLLLKGDGRGNFEVVPGMKNGINVYGEQRGAAWGDFNRNGKVDLAVSQNNGETKLFENQTDRSGLSVQLIGPESNKSAIGSSIRILYQDGREGPRRYIQAGGGYLSQNSLRQVMGIKGEVSAIEVTWFDGSVESVNTEREKEEYIITY
ncbi:VCBS repeat-containing protein [soil metagenome]